MNKPSTFKILGSLDPKVYLDFLNSSDIDWDHSFNKQHNRDKDFTKVSAFPIIDEFKQYSLYDRFIGVSSELITILSDYYGDGVFFKIHFSKMNEYSRVKKHTDNGLGFSLSHRIQIPLLTDRTTFFVGGEPFTPNPGCLFEINNLKKHTVKVHQGERLTLIVDYMEKTIYDYFFSD
jgi:hypothetical protein|tara:strand:+ start:5057 stop:5587 length:531 start_codon:yes stop_codon:yes gene_type:complete